MKKCNNTIMVSSQLIPSLQQNFRRERCWYATYGVGCSSPYRGKVCLFFVSFSYGSYCGVSSYSMSSKSLVRPQDPNVSCTLAMNWSQACDPSWSDTSPGVNSLCVNLWNTCPFYVRSHHGLTSINTRFWIRENIIMFENQTGVNIHQKYTFSLSFHL